MIYPADFNGILAGAPALDWDQFMVAQMWPPLVPLRDPGYCGRTGAPVRAPSRLARAGPDTSHGCPSRVPAVPS